MDAETAERKFENTISGEPPISTSILLSVSVQDLAAERSTIRWLVQ